MSYYIDVFLECVFWTLDLAMKNKIQEVFLNDTRVKIEKKRNEMKRKIYQKKHEEIKYIKLTSTFVIGCGMVREYAWRAMSF